MLVVSPRTSIRFRFSAEKARAGILFMLEREGRHDLHEILGACYLADKRHLNEHNRPVFGASYHAVKSGPIPLEIYGMLKQEPIWLAELGVDSFPWTLEGFRVRKSANDGADLDVLSRSDIDCLSQAHDLATRTTFSARTAVTHGPDWQSANFGTMRYEDMLDEAHDRDRRIAYLREAAPHMKL